MRRYSDHDGLFDTLLKAQNDPAGPDVLTFTQPLAIAEHWIDDVQTGVAPRTLSEVYWKGGSDRSFNGIDRARLTASHVIPGIGLNHARSWPGASPQHSPLTAGIQVNWEKAVSGQWTDANDWVSNSGTKQIHKVPTSADPVSIMVGGQYTIYVTSAAAAASLGVDDASATLNITGGLSVATSIDVEAGKFAVSGNGNLQAAGALTIGAIGDGGLSVSGSGIVNTSEFFVGGSLQSSGDVSITSSGTIMAGTYSGIGGVAGSRANVTIVGTGSELVCSGHIDLNGVVGLSNSSSLDATGGLRIGVSPGLSGTLTVATGSTVTSGSSYESIGAQAGATGLATVDGTKSAWTLSGPVEIGDAGTGSLTVSDSGEVTASQMSLANQSSSVGIASIESSGKLTVSAITVGAIGKGTLSVVTGGTVISTSQVDFFGGSTGATGYVMVNGAGSSWQDEGQVVVGGSGSGTLAVSNAGSVSAKGGLDIGAYTSGTGSLNVAAGGLVTSTGTYQAIGSGPGATGNATVDGDGSIWTISGGLWIGDAGTGSLTVSDSGQVVAGQVLVASQSTGIGTATIESQGQLTVAAIDVGVAGSGSLSLFTGGTLASAGQYDTLGGGGGSGYFAVNGAGSLWKDAGQIIVGGAGTGTLIVLNASSVNAAAGLDIGAYTGGTGTLSVLTGGLVNSTGSYQALGSQSGATGATTVDGAGSIWTISGGLWIGDAGTGSLTVSDSGQVVAGQVLLASQSTGIGTAAIESQGQLTVAAINVGVAGSGSLSLFTGGTLASAGQYDTLGGGGGSGYVAVNGAGSLWKDAGEIIVGGGGNGTLSVSNAGSANAEGGLEIGGYTDGTYGTLSVTSGGIVSSTGTYQAIGASAGATGSATVDGDGSSWTVTGELKVGDSGSGSLTVSDSGLVTVNADQLLVGLSTSGTGSVTIESLGQIIASGQLTVGFAGQSSGSVDIETGGTLITSGPYDTIGSQADSSGSVTVTGTGAVWKSAGAITIGEAGDGTLEVSNGGSVNAGQGIVLGASATGTGSLDVSDGGLLTSIGTYQAIGGGTSTSGTTAAGARDSTGNDPGSIATIAGSGSDWNILGSLWVGNQGAGTLMIEAGGSASVQYNLLVGVLSGTEGQVDVTGTGMGGASTLTVGGSLSLGAASNGGIGMMIVSAGASVSVGSASVIGAGSMLTLSAGTISFPDVNGLGTLSILANGTLQGHGTVNGVISDLGTITAMGGTLLLASRPYALTGTGALIADADSSISLTAGVAFTEAISGDGALSLGGVFNYTMSGSEDITISDLTIAAVSTLAGSGTIASDITSAGNISATGGTLTLSGDVASTGTLQAQPGQVLSLTSDDTLGGLLLGEGTISLAGSDTIGTARITVSYLAIGPDGSLSGTGSITSALANAGTLEAEPGTLTLLGAVTDTGTLMAETGAVLDLAGGGTISGAVTGAGTLRLDGKTPYTLQTGAMVSVQHLAVDAGVTVSGIGTITGSTANQGTIIANGGKLLVSGAIKGVGMLQATRAATIDLTHGGTLTEAISGAGTLELGAAYMLGTKLPTISAIVVDSGATLSGTGKLNTTLTDNGTLLATGGTLSLARAVSGGGTLSASAGSTLSLGAASSFSGLVSGAGEVDIEANLSLSGAASLSAADIVLSANLVQASGDSIGILAGNTLTLSAAAGHSVSVQGAGADRLSNAGSLAAAGAGSAKVSEVFINTGLVTSSAATLGFLGAATNNGSITAASGLTDFSAMLCGSGTVQIGAAGTLSLLAGASAGQTVDFLAATGALDLTKASTFLGSISGFGGSDSIDLVKTAETSYGFANGVLTVMDGKTTVATLDFAGSYTKSDFVLGSDLHGGTAITFG